MIFVNCQNSFEICIVIPELKWWELKQFAKGHLFDKEFSLYTSQLILDQPLFYLLTLCHKRRVFTFWCCSHCDDVILKNAKMQLEKSRLILHTEVCLVILWKKLIIIKYALSKTDKKSCDDTIHPLGLVGRVPESNSMLC